MLFPQDNLRTSFWSGFHRKREFNLFSRLFVSVCLLQLCSRFVRYIFELDFPYIVRHIVRVGYTYDSIWLPAKCVGCTMKWYTPKTEQLDKRMEKNIKSKNYIGIQFV